MLDPSTWSFHYHKNFLALTNEYHRRNFISLLSLFVNEGKIHIQPVCIDKKIMGS